MTEPRDVLWIITQGPKAGGYTTLLSQKEVDHAQAVAINPELVDRLDTETMTLKKEGRRVMYVSIKMTNLMFEGRVVGQVNVSGAVTTYNAPAGERFGEIWWSTNVECCSDVRDIGLARHRHFSDAQDRVLFALEKILREEKKMKGGRT